MLGNTLRRPSSKRKRRSRRQKRSKVVNRLVERDLIHRVSYDQSRETVREVYGGSRGAMLSNFSRLSGHLQLGDRLLRRRHFDLAGVQNILDVGTGAGQVLGHLLKYADPDAQITGIDISHKMLARARNRLKNSRPRLITADLAELPFANGAFDCVTCCYVLEHLPDARTGRAELSWVMTCGGRMLWFATEDTFSGAWTSRMWACRTYNRKDLLSTCQDLGLDVSQELWLSRMHRVFRAGGICLELTKR
ncbi:MAG: class I SAM-dependent methyltransferase [Planctomycetales bacterium]